MKKFLTIVLLACLLLWMGPAFAGEQQKWGEGDLYEQLKRVFSTASGHTHDGTDSCGALVPSTVASQGAITSQVTATTYGLVSIGYVYNGYSVMASGSKAIPKNVAFNEKVMGGKIGEVGTLANGTPGQLLHIVAMSRTGSGTFIITPSKTEGFTTITLDAVGEYATLAYVNDTIGWIIISTNGTVA